MKNAILLLTFLVSSTIFSQDFMANNEDTIITKYATDGAISKVTTVGKVFFAFNESKLNQDSELLLNTIIMVLMDNPEMKICINAYSDSSEKNNKISENRANTTKSYLIKNGIAPSKLKIKSFGATKQIEEEKSSDLNRRVEFTFE